VQYGNFIQIYMASGMKAYQKYNWYFDRDARWLEMRNKGMSYVDIANSGSRKYDPEYVSTRVRMLEQFNKKEKNVTHNTFVFERVKRESDR